MPGKSASEREARTKDIRVMASRLALYNIDRNKTRDTDEAGWMTGAPGWWGNEMVDKNFVLKWAHLNRNPNPRDREIIEEQRRVNEALIAEWQAEQERKNAELAARPINPTRLTLDPRYAKGIAHPSGPKE